MGYYLYDHQNKNAPRRSNGKRFWGYPSRNKPIKIIVVHTAENALDEIGEDTGAEGVARYLSNTPRAASYHYLVDSDSEVFCLPEQAVSFGVRGYNSIAYNASLATRAASWGTNPSREAQMIHRLAKHCADVAKEYDIRVNFVNKTAVDAGADGFTGHSVLDPDRRTDPGQKFDWLGFLKLVRRYQQGQVRPEEPSMDKFLVQANDGRRFSPVYMVAGNTLLPVYPDLFQEAHRMRTKHPMENENGVVEVKPEFLMLFGVTF